MAQGLAWQHDLSKRAALHVSKVRADNCINIVTDQLKCQTASINNGPPHALGRRVYHSLWRHDIPARFIYFFCLMNGLIYTPLSRTRHKE